MLLHKCSAVSKYTEVYPKTLFSLLKAPILSPKSPYERTLEVLKEPYSAY